MDISCGFIRAPRARAEWVRQWRSDVMRVRSGSTDRQTATRPKGHVSELPFFVGLLWRGRKKNSDSEKRICSDSACDLRFVCCGFVGGKLEDQRCRIMRLSCSIVHTRVSVIGSHTCESADFGVITHSATPPLDLRASLCAPAEILRAIRLPPVRRSRPASSSNHAARGQIASSAAIGRSQVTGQRRR